MYRECYSCDDVLLVPKYSEIKSRQYCDPSVDEYSIPLIASCMDTVYSLEMDSYLTSNRIMVMVHRYFQDYKEQLDKSPGHSSNYRFYAVGSVIKDKGKKWIDGLIDAGIKHFVVDMAHGDSKACVETTKYINKKCSNAKVIAGNVAVKSGFNRLQDAGAWAIRVGVGSGCFVPGTIVNTKNKGKVPIEEIKIGDIVYTHTGEAEEVIALLGYDINDDIVEINEKINCTKNHEFYVLHKKYQNIVNENNIEKYTEWIRADELNDDYFLIELENSDFPMKFKLVKIKSIKINKYSGRVHDLTVNKNHSYNVFNILVHNSICSTRLNTGFGVPLLTSVEDCVSQKKDSYLIADGGLKNSGDIAKVIAFGADFAMSGRLWAATSLAPGSCYDKNGDWLCEYDRFESYSFGLNKIVYKRYRGMASREARTGFMKDSSIEGVSGLIPYYGTTEQFLNDLVNNLKASLSYCGAYGWEEFRRRCKPIRITNASWNESQTFTI